MTYVRSGIKQAELTRYAKAMRAAGVEEWRLEILPTGKHVIVFGKVYEAAVGPDPDELLK